MSAPTLEIAAQPGAMPRASARDLMERLATKWRLVPVLVVLVLIAAFFAQQNELFLSPRNLSNLAGQIVVTTMIALGLMFVLLVGEIDLSVAAASAVAAGVMANLALVVGTDAPLAVLAGLATGAALGAINGLIVTRFRVPSFIVTLGIALIPQGLLLRLLPPTNIYSLVQSPISALSTMHLPGWVSWSLAGAALALFAALRLRRHVAMRGHRLASSVVASVVVPVGIAGLAIAGAITVFAAYRGVPLPVAVLVATLGVLAYVTRQTRFGLHLYAIGANPEAASRAGISVNGVKLAAFAPSGLLVGAGGILAATRVMGVSLESADPTLLLEGIAAAVIGGVSLFGGRGSVWSALIGALVIGSVSNGLLLINASTETRLEVQGVILIVAVVLDALLSRSGSKR